jgi:hypothetical protein
MTVKLRTGGSGTNNSATKIGNSTELKTSIKFNTTGNNLHLSNQFTRAFNSDSTTKRLHPSSLLHGDAE